jgi:hypothetical protein
MVVPGGMLFGLVGGAAFAGASTYAMGRVFIQDFESDGAFLSLDPKAVRAFYDREFEQGKVELRESFVSARP